MKQTKWNAFLLTLVVLALAMSTVGARKRVASRPRPHCVRGQPLRQLAAVHH